MKSQSQNRYSFTVAIDELTFSEVAALQQNIESCLQFGSFAEIKFAKLHYQ
jgi:hypothetical protein